MKILQNTQLNILIADSDESTATALSKSLAALGHNVEWADNGIIALEAVMNFVPDIVIIDLDIKNVQASLICRTMQQERDLPNTVFIAQGENFSDHDRLVLRDAGFDYLMEKPVTVALLEKALGHTLKRNPGPPDMFSHAILESMRID